MPDQALGIDISRYQGVVDWARVKAAGICFAIAKATESNRIIDMYFERNWAETKRVGIVRGAYHYFRASQDARAQAEYFARAVAYAPGDIPPVLDAESLDGVDKATLSRGLQTWLAEVERLTGLRPIIYTAPNFWNTNVGAQEWVGGYKLWVAHYTTAAQPIVPKGFRTWALWQYTDQGRVDGIASNVDRNRFNGTTQDLLAWVGSAAPAQPVPATGEAIRSYFQALNRRNLDAVMALYHANSAHVTAQGAAAGPQAIRAWYQDFLAQLPNANFQLGEVTEAGASRTFTWTCTGSSGQVTDGQDTVGFLDGKIAYHTTSFTITR